MSCEWFTEMGMVTMLRDEKLRQKIREIDWDEDSQIVNVNVTPPKASTPFYEKAFDWAITLPFWKLALILAYAAGAAWYGHSFGWF